MIPKFDTNYNSLMLRHFDSLGVLSDVIPDLNFEIIKKMLVTNKPEHSYMYWYHKDHLGSSTQISDYRERVIHHIEYMPSGELFSEQRDNWATPYKFNGKELDSETGLYYYGARYYTPEIGIWLSVDPLSDKYPSMSAYMYCAGNPVILVDPDGREFGDFYTYSGAWLGSDGKKDDKAYVADSQNSDGTFKNAKELSISNSELLDRATWVNGESGGSSEIITNRKTNAGTSSESKDARVSDYYAFAIENAAKKDGGFYKAIKTRMSRSDGNGGTLYTSEGYFEGSGQGGTMHSKNFANARKKGMNSLMSVSGAKTSISAVIYSVTPSLGMSDPTNGCRAWLGGSSAENYVNNPSTSVKGAKYQFSFSSGNKAFNHSFYRK